MSEFNTGDQVEYSVTKTTGEFIKYFESHSDYCLVDFGLCDLALLLVRNINHVDHHNNREKGGKQ
ncbi:hypothetical protein [Acinetobacter baumannii]|uniref:hypothetical protein n=1 Tax=Acinetobacter baumannii TaxID=470 RepID=UPI001F3B1F3C|nr:hypothetical protein [Acinetobacter baumannii]MCF1300046.1 hypothetical protein [Acinetobacter baumannii]HAV4522646.1 hypothetical protein [Acinetobacter baumannii]HAV4564003.1 hypothetical protein [Acinetobacter baumannii]